MAPAFNTGAVVQIIVVQLVQGGVNFDVRAQYRRMLKRELGVFGATMMGLGAMVGTGVFVSIGVAAGAARSAVVFAIGIAALVAECNALSSAQLATSHAVSGGTYEY